MLEISFRRLNFGYETGLILLHVIILYVGWLTNKI